MNILYIAFKDFSKLHFGASKKVISECRAFKKLGHDIILYGRRKNATIKMLDTGQVSVVKTHNIAVVPLLQPVLDKYHQINDIVCDIKNKKYDLCYIRYDLSSGHFLKLIKRLFNICSRIVIEIPTYPYDKEYNGWINRIRLKIDSYYADKLNKYIKNIISFYEIPNGNFHGIPVTHVPNGFDFDEIKIIERDDVPYEIHIAAVSSMRLWHGYERFIEGLHMYYTNGGIRPIYLHLVGDGRECNKYQSLVYQYNLNKNVLFHGAMHGKELDLLLEQCTLGIDSLGRHRTGIYQLSSLKSREYGAKGIPIINSCKIDIIDNDFNYFLQVPANESPINMVDIIAFYEKCYADGSRIKVAKEIRSYIEKKSSMNVVIEQILQTIVSK